jgi:hypothetical protein
MTHPSGDRAKAEFPGEELERLEEMIELLRGLATNNQKMAAQMMGFARVLARDVIAVLDAPTDPLLRGIVVSGARARAVRVLEALGDDVRAH